MAGTDLGRLLGSLLGDGHDAADGPLLGSLFEALGGGGGQSLSGLLQQLRDGGLGNQADSWVASGKNHQVTGPQIAQALPYQILDHTAHQSGLTPEQAADRLARVLPEAVDKLTPEGKVPQGALEDVIGEKPQG